jgi:hypothetical protein
LINPLRCGEVAVVAMLRSLVWGWCFGSEIIMVAFSLTAALLRCFLAFDRSFFFVGGRHETLDGVVGWTDTNQLARRTSQI